MEMTQFSQPPHNHHLWKPLLPLCCTPTPPFSPRGKGKGKGKGKATTCPLTPNLFHHHVPSDPLNNIRPPLRRKLQLIYYQLFRKTWRRNSVSLNPSPFLIWPIYLIPLILPQKEALGLPLLWCPPTDLWVTSTIIQVPDPIPPRECSPYYISEWNSWWHTSRRHLQLSAFGDSQDSDACGNPHKVC